jgi:hypothetical protein
MKTTIENFIGVFEDAYPKEYCDSVIEYFGEAEKAGHMLSRQQQGSLRIEKNDAQVFAHSETSIKYCSELIEKFNNVFWKQVYPQYSEKYSALIQSGPHTNYAFKVQKTEVGGGYHTWHYESATRESSTRLLTWILYLNDVEEGGETEFLYYPKRIKPKTGTFILWPAGFTHTHRGNPPLSNTKYIITGWIEF